MIASVLFFLSGLVIGLVLGVHHHEIELWRIAARYYARGGGLAFTRGEGRWLHFWRGMAHHARMRRIGG
jgi:hypothetical protein